MTFRILVGNSTDQRIKEGARAALLSPRSDWACSRCKSDAEWEIDAYVYKLTSVEESSDEEEKDDEERTQGGDSIEEKKWLEF